ncbi:hypothetical protein Bca101_054336 [Brassica carinata]
MEEPYGENPWTELLQQLEPRTRDVDSEHSQQHEGRSGRRHGEVHHNSDYMISFIDKQVRNRISSLKGRGGKRLDQAMTAWIASRE